MSVRDDYEAVREALELAKDTPFGVPEAYMDSLRRLDVLCPEALAALARLQARQEDADGWLSGLEETYASPNRECADEDMDANGNREGNACIAAESGELTFPDDWCDRCYTLQCVREARAALSASEPAGTRERSEA